MSKKPTALKTEPTALKEYFDLTITNLSEVAYLLAKLMELDALGANVDAAIKEAETFLNRCKY